MTDLLHNPIGSTVEDNDTRTTPRWLFDTFDQFYHFGLDAAANPQNALCEKYITAEEDALKQDWKERSDGRPVWCNPPFSRLKEFSVKCIETHVNGPPVVMVMPANKWEQGWCQGVLAYAAELVFPLGRVSYGGTGRSPEWPSVVAVFDYEFRRSRWAMAIPLHAWVHSRK